MRTLKFALFLSVVSGIGLTYIPSENVAQAQPGPPVTPQDIDQGVYGLASLCEFVIEEFPGNQNGLGCFMDELQDYKEHMEEFMTNWNPYPCGDYCGAMQQWFQAYQQAYQYFLYAWWGPFGGW